MRYACTESPIGRLLLVGDGGRLEAINLPSGTRTVVPAADWHEDAAAFREAITQLEEYFRGVRQEFSLALAPRGTLFQQRVWRALQAIPYGRTATYRDIARAIGQPSAVRAVGLANGRNPLPIVIPCHRVIGSDGSLTGYGGGLSVKQFLLTLERGEPSMF